MFRQIARFDESVDSIGPKLEVKVMGTGITASGKSSSRKTSCTEDDLDCLLIKACEKARRGIFVTIDEVQKVPLDDMSRISGAFQMASRKGHEVMIAIAGLPFAHHDIIQHDGCTFMRRSAHEELGLFTREDVEGAFKSAFKSIRGLSIGKDAMDMLVNSSSGHPYMMQLLGYSAVSIANARATKKNYELTIDDASNAAKEALAAYEASSLDPMYNAMSGGQVAYLEAMAQCADLSLNSNTGDVARLLGKKPSQVTYQRDQLIREGVIIAPERGRVRFAIPFLRGYMGKQRQRKETERLIEEWGV